MGISTLAQLLLAWNEYSGPRQCPDIFQRLSVTCGNLQKMALQPTRPPNSMCVPSSWIRTSSVIAWTNGTGWNWRYDNSRSSRALGILLPFSEASCMVRGAPLSDHDAVRNPTQMETHGEWDPGAERKRPRPVRKAVFSDIQPSQTSGELHPSCTQTVTAQETSGKKLPGDSSKPSEF